MSALQREADDSEDEQNLEQQEGLAGDDADEPVFPIAPPPERTLFWLHLGANLAAREWQEFPGKWQPLPSADYRPEHANAWVPVEQKVTDKAIRARMPPDTMSLPRPTWLLATPIALLMRDHRPFYGSPLRMASNPERIEAGWTPK